MPRIVTGIILSLLVIQPLPAQDQTRAVNIIDVGHFSRADLTDITPPGWRPLNFDSIEKKTAYFLVRDQDITVVKAVSHAGASGYFHKLTVSPKDYPLLRWHWKIENTLNKGNVMTKDGDDYPARIYVSFEYDPQRLTGIDRLKYKLYTLVHDEPPPLAVINYVWASNASIGTIVPNAYTARVKMIVVQSGKGNRQKWRQEERNVYQDYKQAFGEEPGNISGIAIMTDTDNTGESATAWYGDITFLSLNK